MKISKITILLLLISTLVFSLFTGCSLVPDEYTNGVRLDSSYPEDDLPIINGAVIYYCDADDNSVTIRYGTEESLYDVVDFYKDHFTEEGIALTDESDKSTRYTAEGAYKDFIFELRASEPSEGYELQLFSTIVRIEIAFVDEAVPTPVLETPLEEWIIGFWRQESYDDGTGAEITYSEGTAYEFLTDGTLIGYDYFEYFASATWSVIDENTLQIIADGYEGESSVTRENRNGKEYLIWVDSSGTLEFFRDSSDEFSLYDPTAQNADQLLASALTDITWYYVHYSDPEGLLDIGSTGSLICNSDGTFSDTYNDITDTGNWYVQDGILVYEYSDGTTNSWPIEIKSENGDAYLYFYGTEVPEFWLYINNAEHAAQSTPPFAGIVWYGLKYVYADGTEEPYSGEETMLFNSDYTLMYSQADGIVKSGTWEIDGITVTGYFEDKTSKWDLGLETRNGVTYLYLSDYRDDRVGCYWEFTDISLIHGIVTFTTDDRLTIAIAGVQWNELHYEYADGSTDPMESNLIFFYSDGTFDETYNGETVRGEWTIQNGQVTMNYPDDSSVIHPVYIEYDPESDSMALYLGDTEEGYEGGSWVFTTYQP